MPALDKGTQEHVTHEAAQAFIATLPERIRQALEKQAQTIDYPIEAILEMADSFAEPKALQAIWMMTRSVLTTATQN